MSVVVKVGEGAPSLERQARDLIARCVGSRFSDRNIRSLTSGDVVELANALSELVDLRTRAGVCRGCGEILGIDEHLTGCERPPHRLPPPPSLAVPDAALAAKGFQSTGGDERPRTSHEGARSVKPEAGRCVACGRNYCEDRDCSCQRDRARCEALSGSEQCVPCAVCP